MLCLQYYAFITKTNLLMLKRRAVECHCTGVDGPQLPLLDTFSTVVL